MVTCEYCDQTFANKNSLRSHRHKFHSKKRASETEQADTDFLHPYKPYNANSQSSDSQEHTSGIGTERESDTGYDSPVIESEVQTSETDDSSGGEVPKKDTLASDSDDSSIMESDVQTSETDDSNGGEVPKKYTLASDNNTANESAKSSRKRKNVQSKHEYLEDSTSSKRQRRTISQPKAKTFSSKRVCRSTDRKRIHKGINLVNAEKHVKLIKLLCKAVLNGTIQMQPQHVAILKPHGNFVRNIAEGGIKDGKAIIQKEALASKKTGRSVLKTFLETIIPILPSLFN